MVSDNLQSRSDSEMNATRLRTAEAHHSTADSKSVKRAMGRRGASAVAAASVLALFISGCAGGVGSSGSSQSSAEGFDYETSQDDVDVIVVELDPVTLVYQPEATSPNALGANEATRFKEEVEERSNGKIEIEIAWGQSVAGYSEVVDALADGRVDIGTVVPLYDPAAFPAYQALSEYSALAPASPVVGELTTNGMMLDLFWESDAVLDEFTANELIPLTPVVKPAEWWYACGPDNTGAEFDDWDGRQVRVGTALHSDIVTALGGTPVSMDFVEMYEALQRNTVDCTASRGFTDVPSGVSKIAPNFSYLTDVAFGGRGSAGVFGGTTYSQLPLAYKQIIFDAEAVTLGERMETVIGSTATAVSQSKEAGGDISPFPDEVQERIAEVQDEALNEITEFGITREEQDALANDAREKWEATVEELGYEDQGEFENMDEWFTLEDVDFGPIGKKMFEDTSLSHRPS